MVHEDRGESGAIFSEEFLEKSGATTGWGDDEDGLGDFLPPKVGIKEMIEGATDDDHHPEKGEEKQEKGDDDPAAEVEGASEVV